MCRLYVSDDIPNTIDPLGRDILKYGRDHFRAADLAAKPMQPAGTGFDLYPWTGTRELNALAAVLSSESLAAYPQWPHIHVAQTDIASLASTLISLASSPPPDAASLRGKISIDRRILKKFDFTIPDHLIEEGYLAEDTNLQAVPRIAREILDGISIGRP